VTQFKRSKRDLSVLWSGAPDCPVCHRTVSVAPGSYRSQAATQENAGALRYNSPDYPVNQRATTIQHATVDYDSVNIAAQWAADVRAASQRGTGLSSVPADCSVPQEDKGANVQLLQNPNGWVTWWRTGHWIVSVRWHTGLSGGPIDSSLPNDYLDCWGL
jgi:hypothetical protein